MLLLVLHRCKIDIHRRNLGYEMDPRIVFQRGEVPIASSISYKSQKRRKFLRDRRAPNSQIVPSRNEAGKIPDIRIANNEKLYHMWHCI